MKKDEPRFSMREVIKEKYGEAEKSQKHSKSTKKQEKREQKSTKNSLDGYERSTRIVNGIKYSTLK